MGSGTRPSSPVSPDYHSHERTLIVWLTVALRTWIIKFRSLESS